MTLARATRLQAVFQQFVIDGLVLHLQVVTNAAAQSPMVEVSSARAGLLTSMWIPSSSTPS